MKRFLKDLFLLAVGFLAGLSIYYLWDEQLKYDFGCYQMESKPVIYLYPEEKTDVTVSVNYDGVYTAWYPDFTERNGTWRVTADADGMLTDSRGRTYQYLYWEGEREAEYDFSRGDCVRGEDTVAYLESALATRGLTESEVNEFIVYWLPLMKNNQYNIISFQEPVDTIQITPAPDTVIQVFMAFKPVDTYQPLPPQEVVTPTRDGFIVVEWGGAEVK